MEKPSHIVYCRCAYARIVPQAVKQAVLEGLSASGQSFEAVPDLCEMSARKDLGLQQMAEHKSLKIIACYPRAVKWLFNSGGAPLPEKNVEVLNMRVSNADDILEAVETSLDASETDPEGENA